MRARASCQWQFPYNDDEVNGSVREEHAENACVYFSYSSIALSSCGSAPPLSSSSSLSWLRYFCSLSDSLCRSCSHSLLSLHFACSTREYIFFHHLFFIRFILLTLLPIHFLLKFLFLPLSLCLKSNNAQSMSWEERWATKTRKNMLKLHGIRRAYEKAKPIARCATCIYARVCKCKYAELCEWIIITNTYWANSK